MMRANNRVSMIEAAGAGRFTRRRLAWRRFPPVDAISFVPWAERGRWLALPELCAAAMWI